MSINWNKSEYIRSAGKPQDFLHDGMPQVVFAGRSNVGKSSVINRIVNRKNFARVGAVPGKTTQVNYFRIEGRFYLVDLPGYGYAKVSAAEKQRWAVLMERWFAEQRDRSLNILIVDARHKPTQDDRTMSDLLLQADGRYVVLANKLDKLKKSEIEGNLALIRATLELPESVKVIPFSAEKGDGKAEVIAEIAQYVEGKS